MSDSLLIIDDDEADHRLIRAIFRAGAMEAVVSLARYESERPLTPPRPK